MTKTKAHLKAIFSVIIGTGVVYGNYLIYLWEGSINRQNVPFFVKLSIASISTILIIGVVALIALMYIKIVEIFISQGEKR
jgi:hypothetical protein